MVLGIVILVLSVVLAIYIIIKSQISMSKIKAKDKKNEEKPKEEKPEVKKEIVEKKEGDKVVLQSKVTATYKPDIANIEWERHLSMQNKADNLKPAEQQPKTTSSKARDLLDNDDSERGESIIDTFNELSPEMKTIIITDVLNRKKF